MVSNLGLKNVFGVRVIEMAWAPPPPPFFADIHNDTGSLLPINGKWNEP